MNRLVKYLAVVLRWRKFILYNTLAVVLIATGASFLLPKRYTATARLLPPPEDDMLGVSSLLGGGVTASRLGRLRLGSMLGSSTPSDLMVGILSSRSLRTTVIERCSIIDVYRFRRRSVEAALKQLDRMTDLTVGDDGIVEIEVQAKSRKLAAEIANCYVDELDAFLRRSNVSQGRNMRIFLERRLSEVASELALAQESLRVFQERFKTVTVEDEVKAAIETYAKLRSQLYVRQAELVSAEEVSGAGNPVVLRLRGEVAALNGQLSLFERGGSESGFGVGFGVAFGDLPAVGAEFARRYRDARIQEETYAMLYQQFEYAKVMEARDTPTLAILDRAVPPERKSYPRHGLTILVALLFSLAVGVAIAFLSEYIVQLRTSKPDEYGLWQEVAKQLRGLVPRKATRPPLS